MSRAVNAMIRRADELASTRLQESECAALLSSEQHWAAMDLRHAVVVRGQAEAEVVVAVAACREVGLSWDVIGTIFGASGEAVRQRYLQLCRGVHPQVGDRRP